MPILLNFYANCTFIVVHIRKTWSLGAYILFDKIITNSNKNFYYPTCYESLTVESDAAFCAVNSSNLARNASSLRLCHPMQLPVGLRPQPQLLVFGCSTVSVIISPIDFFLLFLVIIIRQGRRNIMFSFRFYTKNCFVSCI